MEGRGDNTCALAALAPLLVDSGSLPRRVAGFAQSDRGVVSHPPSLPPVSLLLPRSLTLSSLSAAARRSHTHRPSSSTFCLHCASTGRPLGQWIPKPCDRAQPRVMGFCCAQLAGDPQECVGGRRQQVDKAPMHSQERAQRAPTGSRDDPPGMIHSTIFSRQVANLRGGNRSRICGALASL